MRPSWETRGRQENGSRRHRLFRVLSGSSSPCERERIPRFFVPRSLHRVYTRISEASSRWVTRGCARCDSHSLLVPLEPRPVFPSVSKLNGNHARISLPLRQNGPRFHPPIRDTIRASLFPPLSLSACPFFSSCSTFEIFSRSREISVPVFLHAIFEIFGKFEDRFARLASTKSRKSKSLGKVSWFCVCVCVVRRVCGGPDSHALSLLLLLRVFVFSRRRVCRESRIVLVDETLAVEKNISGRASRRREGRRRKVSSTQRCCEKLWKTRRDSV